MKPCPNCSQPLADGVSLYPHYGEDTRALWQEQQEQDMDQAASAYVRTRRIQRRKDKLRMLAGFLIAMVLSCALPILYIGSGLSFILYLSTKSKDRHFSLGVGLGSLAGLLGATAVCVYFSTHPWWY